MIMRTNSHIRKDVKQSQPNDNEDYLQQRYREFAEITSTIKIVDDMNVQMRDSEELSKWKISSKINVGQKAREHKEYLDKNYQTPFETH